MNVQTRTPQAMGYTPQQMNAAFNQRVAEAHQSADPRYAGKGLDRPGMSRAAGHQYLAGVQSAQNLADGIAQAYSQNINDQASNAGIGLANQTLQEDTGLAVGGMAQQQRYADALAALQRQNMMQSGVLGGLIGGNLDSFLGF